MPKQDWIFVNFDRREYRYIGYLGDGWFDDWEMTLDGRLGREVVDPHSLGMLGKLPTEMIRAVFSQVTNVHDTAALTLTNRFFVDFGPGTGSRLEGIPKQFFTEAEIAEFSKDDVELFDQITASRGVYPGMPDSERLDAHLTHRFVQVYHEDGKYRDYKDNRLRHEAFRWTKTSDEFKIAHEINYMQGWDFDIDVWMACNLNKKQYIRQDAVDAMNKKDGSPFAHSWAGLGHCCLGFVVGVLVCWPQEGDDEVERGPWAGDRVAIITVDKMKEIEGEWTDISEEATRLTWAIPYLQ